MAQELTRIEILRAVRLGRITAQEAFQLPEVQGLLRSGQLSEKAIRGAQFGVFRRPPQRIGEAAARFGIKAGVGTLGAAGGAAVGGPPGAVLGAGGGLAAGEMLADILLRTPKTPEEAREQAMVDVAAGITGQAVAPVVSAGVAKGARGLLLGGRASLRRAQRIFEAFQSFGRAPTVGQATGGRFVRGAEAILSKIPGSAGRFRSDALKDAAAFAERVEGLAGAVGRGAELTITRAGQVLERGLTKRFVDRFKNTSARLFGVVRGLVPGDHSAQIDRTIGALEKMRRRIPDAPALSAIFENPTARSTLAAIEKDAAERLAFLVRPGAQTGLAVIKKPGGRLPYRAVESLRSEIGRRLADFSLVDDIPRSELKALYGALTEDLKASLRGLPGALKAFNRATTFYRAGMKRIDDVLERLAKKGSPERIFRALETEIREGTGSASTVRAVKRSLDPDEWQVAVATILRRMGRGTPGGTLAPESPELAGQFSIETFLTNWNRLSAGAKDALFAGRGLVGLRASLDDLAVAASAIRASGRVLANPSGTAGQVVGQGLILGGVAAATAGSPAFIFGILKIVGATNAMARLMTSEKFVRWLVTATRIKPNGLAAHIGRLGAIAKAEDPDTRAAILRLAALAEDALVQKGRFAPRRPNPMLAR